VVSRVLRASIDDVDNFGAHRRRRSCRPQYAAAIMLATALASGCGGTASKAPVGTLVLPGGPAPALAALPHGELLVGFLRTGTIWRVRRGHPPRRDYAPIAVSTAGQRGLLSLVALRAQVYAAWTDRSRHLVVGRLRRTRSPVIVWRGGPTTTLANGGHLAAAPDGRLTIGIGDHQAGRPIGRLLSIDPSGPATQAPRTLSTGWNNPFAFAYTPDGRLWVADNAPGRRAERLARGDRGGGPPTAVTTLRRRPAASGLAALGSRELALCGVVSGTLDRYELDDGRWHYDRTIARGCRYGVARLSDGRLAFSTDAGVRTVAR
jgi:hypothetical protein